jgi:protein TonB
MAIPRAHAGSLAPEPVVEVTVDLVAPEPEPPPLVTPPAQRAVTYFASVRRGAVVSPVSRHQEVAPVPPASAPSALAVASPALPRFSLVVGSVETTGGVVSTGGVGQATPNATPAAADALDDRGASVPAYLVSSGRPEYPSEARSAAIEADVPLEIVVDEGGHVVASDLLHQAGHGFDEAALRAIRNYRFAPAQRDGHPVRVRMRWTVAFRLE